LHQDFQSICPLPVQRPQKSFVKTLLRMLACRQWNLNNINLQETSVTIVKGHYIPGRLPPFTEERDKKLSFMEQLTEWRFLLWQLPYLLD